MNKKTYKTLLICAAALIVTAMIAAAGFFIRPVNIWMFHSVSDEPINPAAPDLSVSSADFERLIKYIADKNIKCGFIGEKADLFITLDDGYTDNFTTAFPILKKYSIPATVFAVASLIGTEGYLTKAQILEMSDSGLVSIQSHGYSHTRLDELDSETLAFELEQAKNIIESITGKPVTALSYPEGSYNKAVIQAAEKFYTQAVTTKTPNIYNCRNKLSLPRTGIPSGFNGDIYHLTSKINFYELLKYSKLN